MGPGLWKRVAPIHLNLYRQDVGSVASLQNTRGREGGREGRWVGREGGGREGRGREGGMEQMEGERVHVSVSVNMYL